MSLAQDQATLTMLSLKQFDHSPTWTQTKAPNESAVVVGHVRNLGNNDIELINAYGADALECTAKAADFPITPVKFDNIKLADGRSLVVQDVRLQIGYNGVVILYKMYLKGSN